jgi:hypothetical protein
VRTLRPPATIVEPAAPWTARPAITPNPLLDSAMSTQEAMNRIKPPMNVLRRPKTSPSAPDVTMKAAPTSEYPVTAHCSVLIGDPVSSLIDGSRMATAEVLALTTNVETQAAARTPAPAERSEGSAGALTIRTARRRR